MVRGVHVTGIGTAKRTSEAPEAPEVSGDHAKVRSRSARKEFEYSRPLYTTGIDFSISTVWPFSRS
jgi:hypothetical protein